MHIYNVIMAGPYVIQQNPKLLNKKIYQQESTLIL